MSKRKTTGRTVMIDDEVFLVACDKVLPRHYIVAGTFLIAMLLPQIFRAGEELDALLYTAFIGLATLGLAWLFDDRETYRLRKVLSLPMPKASEPLDGEGQET